MNVTDSQKTIKQSITVSHEDEGSKFTAVFFYKNQILQQVNITKEQVGHTAKQMDFPADDFLQIIEAYDVCQKHGQRLISSEPV